MKLGRTKVGDIKLIFFLAEQISIANFPSQNIARVNLLATDEMMTLIFQVRIHGLIAVTGLEHVSL